MIRPDQAEVREAVDERAMRAASYLKQGALGYYLAAVECQAMYSEWGSTERVAREISKAER